MGEREIERMIVICETLDEGHGVSLSMLSKYDLSFLAEKYNGEIYLCMMGGSAAVRLKL